MFDMLKISFFSSAVCRRWMLTFLVQYSSLHYKAWFWSVTAITCCRWSYLMQGRIHATPVSFHNLFLIFLEWLEVRVSVISAIHHSTVACGDVGLLHMFLQHIPILQSLATTVPALTQFSITFGSWPLSILQTSLTQKLEASNVTNQ